MALGLEALVAKARRHWAEWLPEKTAALREAGELEPALRAAARAAMMQAQELMAQGYRAHEAEEVVLAEFILLTPEPGAEMDDEEREEDERLEAEYREEMAAYLGLDTEGNPLEDEDSSPEDRKN